MDSSQLRAWWWQLQGLDGSLTGASPAVALERAGWARSVGGAGPYLSIFSRTGASRADIDQAVAATEIHELPAARNCTYVVPASDFALALKVGQAFLEADLNVGRKLGVTDKEVEKLCAAVVGAVGKKPFSPDEIREAVGGAARNLGEAGKKKGLTTTLPLALGKLQAFGEIRRVPVNGRLDQQRYGYVRWQPNPLAKFKLSAEEAYTELARRYFSWIGPATVAEFQWFSALGVKAAKAAIEPLGLVPLEAGSQHLIFSEAREKLAAFKPPKQAQYVLASSLDGLMLLRRDMKGLLDPADQDRKVPTEKGAAAIGGLADLPSHAIFDRGRVVGLWEFDVNTSTIVWTTFVPRNDALKKAVSKMEAFVRDDLGDARSFSLDSPKSREPRIAALRAAAG
jgi:hypothetical protein